MNPKRRRESTYETKAARPTHFKMETYDIQRTMGETYDEQHFGETVAREVETAMREVGYSPNLRGMVQAKPGSEPANAGFALIPELSDPILEGKENGFTWLTVNHEIASHFGEVTGSAEVTHTVVNHDLSARDVILAFEETATGASQIQKGIHMLELLSQESDPDPVDIMAYNLWEKALGWYAEKILTATGDFKKGSASQDTGGIDMTHYGTPIQLKTVTRYASKGPKHFRTKETDHMFYGWAGQKLIVGTTDEANDVAGEMKTAAGASSKTIMKKSENTGELADYHRPARVIWWQ